MNRVMVVGSCGLLALSVHFKAEDRCVQWGKDVCLVARSNNSVGLTVQSICRCVSC